MRAESNSQGPHVHFTDQSNHRLAGLHDAVSPPQPEPVRVVPVFGGDLSEGWHRMLSEEALRVAQSLREPVGTKSVAL